MALRLIDAYLPAERGETAAELLADDTRAIEVWSHPAEDGRLLMRILVAAEQSEEILDRLRSRFEGVDGFLAVLLPVEAIVPRPDDAKAETSSTAREATEEDTPTPARVSREELYADISDSVKFSQLFVVLVVLSSLVAAVGLLRDSVAIIVGAMVIAPLLSPNVALAFATTLGDFDLMKRALTMNFLGLAVSLSLAAVIGFALSVSPDAEEMASRTAVGFGDIVLALAAGMAGVLTFTTGVPTALVGVMVAVALLPPAVVGGMLAGAGHYAAARGALLLLATNVICVNLAGVTTFLVQGIAPMRWWEAERARRATRQAIALWIAALLTLIALIVADL